MDKKTLNSNNRSIEEIREMYDTLVESIRHNVSLKLMDTNKENPLKVYIPLEHGAMGLSTLQMPTIVKLWQHPTEGLISFCYEDDPHEIDFDFLSIEDRVQIVNHLENFTY